MPATSVLLRWGWTLLVALIAIVVAYRLQQPLPNSQYLGRPTKYCYTSVRTHDTDKPSAKCFTVEHGVFRGVLAEDEPNEEGHVPVNDAADVEVSGHVIPGLWDGHGHLLQYGEFLHSVDLFGSGSLDEARRRIKEYVEDNPGAGSNSSWIRGVGWDQTLLGRMPTAADIEEDEQLKGVYMMLDRIDVHCAWVSQAVLDLLPADIPDIPGGDIVRDPGMGVFCDNAMDYVTSLWPQPGPVVRSAMIRSAMASLNEYGIVGMHDAGVTPENLRLYSASVDSDDWTVRVYAMLECGTRNAFCPGDAVRQVRPDGKFMVRSVKLFADGALGSWGSAMIEPYTDNPSTSGSLLVNASTLTQVAKLWAGAGFQVNIHAIGDLANRYAIDALEAALEQECPGGDLAECQARHRFRIEHAQIIHPDDQRRLHAIGIIPSIQPTHATSDMKYALDRLGKQRLQSEAYRMRSILDAKPVLGSDFPVEPADPFQGIYAAVARKSPHTGLGAGGSEEGWHTEEALDLDQALWGFTRGVAHGAFLEDKAGIIREGAFADWVVLDEPLEQGMDVEKLRNIRVRETWVGGRRVYARED
ncbi:putative amidohydrolase YtcJ [Paramyrothecium foliicola]|nr:putative amidohydrolase YtcJ [Paramyrothecium foliicola]